MPFVRTAIFKDFALMIENDAFDFRLNFKSLRNANETIDDGFKHFLANCRRLRLARVFRLENRRGLLECCFLAGPGLFNGFDFFERHFQPKIEFRFERSLVVFAQHPGVQQLAFINLSDRWSFLDPGVKIGLSKRGFVALVMAVAPIAKQIDYRVASELPAKIKSNVANELYRQRIVAIYMKNWR